MSFKKVIKGLAPVIAVAVAATWALGTAITAMSGTSGSAATVGYARTE